MSAWLADFHFLRPAWLLALALLPVLAWYGRRQARRADPWRRICDPALLPYLVQESAGVLRSGAMPWLAAAGFVLLVLALAGPSFRQEARPVVQLQAPLILAVDLSERMRATDLKPDRMSRLRFKLADLLARRGEGQTALIGYAGDAFTVAPLTDDAASLGDLAAALSPDVMPLPGQRADRAIELALRLLRDAGEPGGDLLLFTDQVDGRASNAARAARDAGLRVSVLGVGTAQGAPVPRARGGFLQDDAGAILIPRLDASSLEQLARLGGGRYAELTVDAMDLDRLGVTAARVDATTRIEEGARSHLGWRDEGPWLLLALLPLAALAFRRGWLVVVALMIALPVAPAQALEWRDLWQRPDQRAWEALQEGDAKAAQALARDPALRGAAAYRAEDYAAATEAFARRDDATGSYNLGNALVGAGRYEEALDAYARALALQPDFPDAAANRKALEEWLRQRQEQSSPQDSPQDGQDSGKPSSDGSGQDNASGDEPDEDGPPSSQESDAPPDGEPETKSGAQDEASEAERKARDGSDGSEAGEDEAGKAGEDAERYAQEMQQALDRSAAEEQSPADEGQPAPLTVEEAERQQAMEHLLQRVPDDPGGLLRRKFQLELQRRQREGERR
ncbi:MAG: VWA domain-containing protein [Chiayiivirga sp.]|jgi:Ca-activated chloride channel family protein|nr:VWA domain-containing protein [Chiayiivirga sp.]